MLINELLKFSSEQDTSASCLVDIMIQRNDSSARDSSAIDAKTLMAKEKLVIKALRHSVNRYNIDEWERISEINEERAQVQSFISRMIELQSRQSYDECMYQIYKHFKRWTSESSLSRCDYVLKYVSIDDFDIHILISLLMASYPMRSRLSYRTAFYEKVLNKAKVSYSSEDIHRIFGSLE